MIAFTGNHMTHLVDRSMGSTRWSVHGCPMARAMDHDNTLPILIGHLVDHSLTNRHTMGDATTLISWHIIYDGILDTVVPGYSTKWVLPAGEV